MACNNSYTILAIVVVSVILIYVLFFRSTPQSEPPKVTPVIVEEQDTDIDNILDTDIDEEFGMYESALPGWLDRHSEQKVDSVNSPVHPVGNDYMPYDASARFQTPRQPLPVVNPDYKNHIRHS